MIKKRKPYQRRGGVYKRPDTGTLEIRLQIKGRKYYRSLPEAQNKEQVKVAMATLRREIYEGRYGRDGLEFGATDFVKFCNEVYLPSIKDRLRQWKARARTVAMLCNYFRGKRLKDIGPMAVERFRRARLSGITQYGRRRLPCSVKEEINALSGVFSLAQDNDLIGLNPCRKLKWKREDVRSQRSRVLTEAEEGRLMEALRRYPETRAAAVIALNSGLRKMTILKLRTNEVDMASATLETTTKGGKRIVVPLNHKAVKAVAELMSKPTAEGFLFHSRTGNSLSQAGRISIGGEGGGDRRLSFP